MAETLEARQKVQRTLEDIHKSLIAVSQKAAQLELDLGEDAAELQEQIAETVNQLGPLIDGAQGLEADYQMETNRLQNEDALA